MTATQRRWLYGFATAHVQRYLLSSTRLRDLQGASQLLESLCGEVFTKTVLAAGLPPEAIVTQAAGGARVLSSNRGALQRLHAAWPMVSDRHAPGASVSQALVEVPDEGGTAEAHSRMSAALRAARAAPLCDLPTAGPIVEQYARTGLPSEAASRVGDVHERVDRSTEAKRRAWDALHGRPGAVGALDLRFLGPLAEQGYRFARGRDALAEGLSTSDLPYVGVLHADGNEVGLLIRDLATGAEEGLFRKLSDSLSAATQAAVQRAVAEVLLPAATASDPPALPARPVVLGGDDLTLIVSAPRALAFARAFLEAFEQETATRLAPLGAPDGLTACAGVALVKDDFPFDRAYELADSLCSQAKRHAKRSSKTASAVAFHRVTTSLPLDAATVLEQELTGPAGRLTFGAYGVGRRRPDGLATFADLERFAKKLADTTSRSAWRTLLDLLHEDPERGREAFGRISEMARRRGPRGRDRMWDVERALERLTDGGPWRDVDGVAETPLLDAHVLHVVGALETP